MKKTRKTQLTALMFAAAGVGGLFTVCDGQMLYRVPADASVSGTTTTTTTAALRMQGTQLTASAGTAPAGDVDGNGQIDVSDAIALQKYLLGKKAEIHGDAADLDADGEVDIFDLGLLKREVIAQMQAAEQTDITEQTDTTEPVTFPTTVPIYGPPIWYETETDTEPQDVYGPPNWFTTEPTEPPTETTEPIPQTEYGPPYWEETTDETTTAPPEYPETTMETLYGPPNLWN